jgi:NAD(P)H dehydrogenase (quinone)
MTRGFAGTRVAVVYDGDYDHMEQVAEAVARGVASVQGVVALAIRAEDVGHYWSVLERVEAIVFGGTTRRGNLSAEFRSFMDATSNSVFARGYTWADKLAAGFTHAKSHYGEGLASLQQIAHFAARHQMHWVNLGLPSEPADSASVAGTLYRHGYFIGAVSQSPLHECAESTPPDVDLRTAEFLGARVAEVASQLAAGRALLDAFDTPVH